MSHPRFFGGVANFGDFCSRCNDALYLLHRMPWPDAAPPERASIKVRMYLGARMDHDNAMARLKFLLDWLVMSHYIADDSPKRLEWEGLPEQVVKRDGNYRVEITLTPLAAGGSPRRKEA